MFDRAFLAQLSHVKVVMPTPSPDRARVADPQLWFDLDEATWRAKYLQGDDARPPRGYRRGDHDVVIPWTRGRDAAISVDARPRRRRGRDVAIPRTRGRDAAISVDARPRRRGRPVETGARASGTAAGAS